MSQNDLTKLSAGRYLYRGYEIHRIGYHSPDHKIVWEAFDKNGYAVVHSFSLRNVKFLIDNVVAKCEK